MNTIVVGTDGSFTAAEAVRRAADIARREGATLYLVTAYQPKAGWERRSGVDQLPEGERWKASPGEVAETLVREAAEGLAAEGIDARFDARPGDAADVLVAAAADFDADLLVIGNRGMQGTGRIVSPSVPNRVSHRASCDVLIVDTTAAA